MRSEPSSQAAALLFGLVATTALCVSCFRPAGEPAVVLDGGSLVSSEPHPDSGPPTKCTIDGVGYPEGTLNPLDHCGICEPGQLPTGWTSVPCGPGSACRDGNCIATCSITGVTYLNRDQSPTDPMSCCNAGRDSTGWTPRLLDGGTYSLVSPGSTSPGYIVAADMNGDGWPDLVIANFIESWGGDVSDGNTLSVRMNRGGTFSTETTYPLAGYATDLEVGDLDGDGSPDVVVSVSNQYGVNGGGFLSVFLNRDGGALALPLNWPMGLLQTSLRDFDGDGRIDMVGIDVWRGVNFLRGNGDGSFQEPVALSLVPPLGGVSWPGIAVADLRGNGLLDIASPVDGKSLSIFLGNGDGTFQSEATQPTIHRSVAPVVLDFNGDGIPDIVTAVAGADADDALAVSLGHGDGTFEPVVPYPAPVRQPSSMIAADLLGKGAPAEIVLGTYGAQDGATNVSILWPTPDGGHVWSWIPTGNAPYYVTAADFNQDGATDLAIAKNEWDGGSLTILFNGCP